jgi:hypothetical protein
MSRSATQGVVVLCRGYITSGDARATTRDVVTMAATAATVALIGHLSITAYSVSAFATRSSRAAASAAMGVIPVIYIVVEFSDHAQAAMKRR